MGGVVRHHEIVGVVRNVRAAREGRLQNLVVEPALDFRERLPPGARHRRRHLDLVLVVTLLPRFAAAGSATPGIGPGSSHGDHQLLDGVHVGQRLGGRRLAELALQSRGEFVVHQAVEAQLRKGRGRPDLGNRALADGGDELENPVPGTRLLAGLRGRFAAAVAQPAHELGPLHLAGRRPGQRFVRELDGLDPLVQRQAGGNRTEVGLDLLPAFRGLLLGDDDRRDLLGHPVGQPHDRELGDQLRRGVDLFHFVGVDVLAAAVHDHVLAAADQEEMSVLVEASQVARVEPAVAQRFRRRLVVAVVAGHDVRPLGRDLADPRGVGVHDADLDSRQGLADAADGNRAVRRSDCQDGGGLREPVALGNMEAETPERLPGRLRESGRAADQIADPAPQRGVHRQEDRGADVDSGVLPEEVRRVNQRGGEVLRPRRPIRERRQDAPPQEIPEGGHPHDAGGVSLLEFLVDGLGADLLQIGDLGTPGERQQEAGGELERMVERQDAERAVLLADVVDRRQFGDQRGEVAVRQHHPLGRAGGSGGEEDGGQRRGADPYGAWGRRLLVLSFTQGEDIPKRMDGDRRRRAVVAGEPGMALEQRIAHQHRLRVPETEKPDDLLAAQVAFERNRGRPDPLDREVRHAPLG